MKKLLFIFLALSLSLLIIPGKAAAYIGQCCSQTNPAYSCDSSSGPESCSGAPSEACSGDLYFTHTCVKRVVGGGGSAETFKPKECTSGMFVTPSNPGVITALGCIPSDPRFISFVLFQLLVGVGGGIALLLMLVGATFILTSRGNPEQVKRGKEVFVGALAGLLFIIFSTLLMELIGVDILGLFQGGGGGGPPGPKV